MVLLGHTGSLKLNPDDILLALFIHIHSNLGEIRKKKNTDLGENEPTATSSLLNGRGINC